MIPINRPILDVEEMRAVARVIRSGILTNKGGSGQQVTQLESSFAKFIGTKFAVAVNSGTAALHVALLSAGVGPKDEVIVPSFTFVATAEMVALTGATPVFVDIDPSTYCIDPEEVRWIAERRLPDVNVCVPAWGVKWLYPLQGDIKRMKYPDWRERYRPEYSWEYGEPARKAAEERGDFIPY